MNKLLICEYNNCNKYLTNPITLPCCKIICNEHIQQQPNEKFDCNICKKSHQVPENGYPVSERLNEIIKLGLHLSEEKKKGCDLISRLKSVINELEQAIKDPSNYIYEHFSRIKNKIDIERERIKLQVDKVALEFLDQVISYQNECNSNPNKQIEVNDKIQNDLVKLSNESIPKWQNEFRIVNIDQWKVKKLNELLEANLNERLVNMKDVDANLLMQKSCNLNIKGFEFKSDLFANININYIPNLMNSVILKSIDQQRELIKLCEFNVTDIFKFKLIYRASSDGFSTFSFQKKCEGKSKTLTIIKEKENEYIFGGFAEAAWAKEWVKDPKAFIFSLINHENNPLKINVTNSNCAITLKSWVQFNQDICICSDSNIYKESHSIKFGQGYAHPNYRMESDKAKNFLAGSPNFCTSEIEVYQLV